MLTEGRSQGSSEEEEEEGEDDEAEDVDKGESVVKRSEVNRRSARWGGVEQRRESGESNEDLQH